MIKGGKGHSIQEYAIILFLVGVVSVGSLSVLGGRMDGLFDSVLDGNASDGSGGGFKRLLSLVGAKDPANPVSPDAASAQTATYKIDPRTGETVLRLNMTGANTTSVEGTVKGVESGALGSVQLAGMLERLAETGASDPVVADYYSRLTKIVYYLGANQGSLDEVPGLALDPGTYGKADALEDMKRLLAELETELAHVPQAVQDHRDWALFRELNLEVSRIAHQYQENLQNKEVPRNPQEAQPAQSSAGEDPGAVITAVPTQEMWVERKIPYEAVVPYQELKTTVNHLMEKGAISSMPVEVVLTAAGNGEAIAESAAKPRTKKHERLERREKRKQARAERKAQKEQNKKDKGDSAM